MNLYRCLGSSIPCMPLVLLEFTLLQCLAAAAGNLPRMHLTDGQKITHDADMLLSKRLSLDNFTFAERPSLIFADQLGGHMGVVSIELAHRRLASDALAR